MYETGIYERVGSEQWRQGRRRGTAFGWRDAARVGGASGAIAGAPLIMQAYGGDGLGGYFAAAAWLAVCLIVVLIGFKPKPRRIFGTR